MTWSNSSPSSAEKQNGGFILQLIFSRSTLAVFVWSCPIHIYKLVHEDNLKSQCYQTDPVIVNLNRDVEQVPDILGSEPVSQEELALKM